MSLPARYSTIQHQLAIGFEPLDALRGQRTAAPTLIEVESPQNNPHAPNHGFNHLAQRSDVVPGVGRGEYGLHRMLFLKRYPTPNEVVVRLRDKGRRFVPRRFRVAVPARVAADAERRPLVSRRQAPLMFPGAAYDVGQRRSGLRGRVLRNGEPMRWAWIDAFYLVNVGDDANPNFLRSGRIGRAISDDRGEFLLVLNPLPPAVAGVPDLVDPLWVNVVVNGPSPAPGPAVAGDALWDLPLENLPVAGQPDPAANPNYTPPGYAADIGVDGNRDIPFPIGRMLTGADVPDFICSLP